MGQVTGVIILLIVLVLFCKLMSYWMFEWPKGIRTRKGE